MSLSVQNLSYIYAKGTPYEKKALDEIDLEVKDGEFLGLIGHTGSGKSTLIQHLNALLKPTTGSIFFHGQSIYEKSFDLNQFRQKVGLVFQYPEHQLFEENVFLDVSFGPKNMGLSEKEVKERARYALDLVGLDPSFDRRSPFLLSGGQKRRVAIAGVLAMKPEILILDEPTAGLDPRGKTEILDQILTLHKTEKISVVLVSHSMEEIAKYVDRLVVLSKGKKRYDASPAEVFAHRQELEEIGLLVPQMIYIAEKLNQRGFCLSYDLHEPKDLAEEIVRQWKAAAQKERG
ncbi:energy-coupling factor transporter ATP-binding protein EcfA2 [Clostridia bacterium]|nr:energy-coupling factor transporter ATP-binding protein EcfA2 [Clostridia bacterium]